MQNEIIIEKLNKVDAEEVKKAFMSFLSMYLKPAFGSVPKRNIDVALFIKLQELGVISENPEVYDLISQLRVTRSKARNLLYESKLWQSSTLDLDNELKETLKNVIFLKDNDKVGLEISNPFLIDYLKSKLRELNHITDGSFSPELVRLSVDAFVSLIDYYLPNERKKEIEKQIVKLGLKGDTSIKGIVKSIVKKMAGKVADKAGEEIIELGSDMLNSLFTGTMDFAKDLLNADDTD